MARKGERGEREREGRDDCLMAVLCEGYTKKSQNTNRQTKLYIHIERGER